jgi:hypothetical protein
MTDVIADIQQKIGLMLNSEPMLRTIATSMVPVMRARVHVDGLDANGRPIGTYSKEYLKQRQKAPLNRTGDPKIILSATRQMEQDLKAIPTNEGWGIGYSNPENYAKAMANEKRENVKILSALTESEENLVLEIANDYIDNIVKQI